MIIARLTAMAFALLALAACNTLAGAEEDAGIAGEAVVDAGQDVRTHLAN